MNTFNDFTTKYPLTILNCDTELNKYHDQMLFFKLGDFTFNELSYLHGPYLPLINHERISNFDVNNLYDKCVIITNDIDEFIEHHKNINKTYYLIVSFTDQDVPHKNSKDSFIELLDNKYLIKCITVNRAITHNKLSDFPISIWPWSKTNISNYNVSTLPKREKLCFGGCWSEPDLPHGRERNSVRKTLENGKYGFIDVFEESPASDYINLLLTYKYQISPRGCGVDCFRTWESLYLGCIPIILTDENNNLYEDLPVLIVDSYSDLTEEKLTEHYEKMNSRLFNLDMFKERYWKDFLCS
tara:strand:- start:97 stop:993 length:897 start_codon:yes stop_codon:yes gene_type:complete